MKAALLVFDDLRGDVESQIRIGSALGSLDRGDVSAALNGAGRRREAA
jgi:hypothetical protein